MSGEARILASKLSGAASQLRFLPRALDLVWAAAHHWTLLWLALVLALGALPVATVYLTRALVDALTAAVGPAADPSQATPAFLLATTLGGVLLFGEALGSLAGWVPGVQAKLVEEYLGGLVHRQSTTSAPPPRCSARVFAASPCASPPSMQPRSWAPPPSPCSPRPGASRGCSSAQSTVRRRWETWRSSIWHSARDNG